MALIKSHATLDNLILAPHVQSARGAVCLTCGRLVDEEAIVEGYPGESVTAKYLVRHHGAEELRTFHMGSTNWDHTDLRSYVRRTNWFDPTAHEGTGMGQLVIPSDGYVDPEPTKVIVGGDGK
jgi:hypothetical protein